MLGEHVIVYCDASTRKTTAIATSIALTSKLFVGVHIGVYDVETSTEGELRAILQSVDMIREIEDADGFTIQSDCRSLVLEGRSVLQTRKVRRDVPYKGLWYEFLRKTEGLNLRLKYIKAHDMFYNPNRACDTLSRNLLPAVGGF